MAGSLKNIVLLKCPNCGKGDLFKGNAYHPKHIIDMPHHCENCKQLYFLEPGFYYGAMYVSYGVSVGLGLFFLVIVWSFWGFSADKLMSAGFIMTGLLFLIFPYNLRISRAIWLYLFYKDKPVFYEGDDNSPSN